MTDALAQIGIHDSPKAAPSADPLAVRDAMEVDAEQPEDDYLKFKKLEKQLEHLDVMEEYIKLETRNLEKELLPAQEEVKRIQSVPVVIGQFLEAVDHDHAIVGSTTGSNYYVRVLSILDRELLKPGCSVALHKYSNALVDVLPTEADSSIQMLRPDEKPDVTYADIGGLDVQKQEVREAVELPLTHGELYQQIGIDPPRGVLMYGPPGCGKTMLAKAVAAHTTASFIRVVGSEFVQKYLGEGPRMVIMATNRQDTLDPALLRPGRLDRKIEFPTPDRRQKRLIFSAITSKMNLSDEVDIEDFVARPDKISGADINSICQEAGMHAVRENRYVVLTKDFQKAFKSVMKKNLKDFESYSRINGAIYGEIERLSPAADVSIAGDLRVWQRKPLPSYGRFNLTEDLQQLNETELVFASSAYVPFEMQRRSLDHNYTLQVDRPIQHWNSIGVEENATTFTLNFHFFVPEQELTYRCDALELLKWVWIQYLALSVLVRWLFDHLSGFLFQNQILPSIVHVEALKQKDH
ncbi:AAA domain-containing protein [Aphelenchoides fujianensis]|nr:AAA domain-containing protein [Aphelenchoides fujianensis]